MYVGGEGASGVGKVIYGERTRELCRRLEMDVREVQGGIVHLQNPRRPDFTKRVEFCG